ncbi:MAG: hypothetical protein AABX55_00725 [Nanoarchaeota archaeon]
MDNVISYEILYDILRREKSKPELQKLDKTFFNDFKAYLKEKLLLLESQKQKSSIFAQKEIEKTQKQIDNVKKLIKELYEKRESKIINLALSAAKTNNIKEDNLLEEEKELFNNIVVVLKNSKKALDNVFEKELPKEIKSEETRLIRFIQAVPKFIGDDLNEYGPFEEEYIASLPIKVADLLIKNKRAEPI